MVWSVIYSKHLEYAIIATHRRHALGRQNSRTTCDNVDVFDVSNADLDANQQILKQTLK